MFGSLSRLWAGVEVCRGCCLLFVDAGDRDKAQQGPAASAAVSSARPPLRRDLLPAQFYYLPSSCRVTTENQLLSFFPFVI